MQRNRRTTRQGRLFEPDGPGNILKADREELLDLLAQLIREAVTSRASSEGGGHEQDHV